MDDRFLKRLHKKARKGHRGWPIATIAFYGPNLSQATKVVVGIVTSENTQAEPLRDWKGDRGDIRADPAVARAILEFIESHGVLSVAMTDGIIGIVTSENTQAEPLRDWKGDIRADPAVARAILEFIESHGVLSVAMTDGIIGCPHQEGIDYEGEWCPVCEFWHGRDRFTGERIH